jgi:hypothetical protein
MEQPVMPHLQESPGIIIPIENGLKATKANIIETTQIIM